MKGKILSAIFITVVITACGGGGSNSSNGDNGDVIDRILAHYNRSNEILLTGGIYEIDAFSDPDYIGSQPGCFDYPALTREAFLDGRSVSSQTGETLCLSDQSCYTIAENVVVESVAEDEYVFNIVLNDIGHVKARTLIIDDIPRAYFYLDIFETRPTRSAESCGYSEEAINFPAQFESLTGEYNGRIFYTSPDDRLTPLQSGDISLFCNNDACTLGNNALLRSETSSNTYRANANDADYLTGEFTSADGSVNYTFHGGASYYGNVIAGIAFIDDGETPPACNQENDCLLLAFSRQQ